jgi:hypothetical protein
VSVVWTILAGFAVVIFFAAALGFCEVVSWMSAGNKYPFAALVIESEALARTSGGNAQHTYHLWRVAVRLVILVVAKGRINVGIHDGDGFETMFHSARRGNSGVRRKGLEAGNKRARPMQKGGKEQ